MALVPGDACQLLQQTRQLRPMPSAESKCMQGPCTLVPPRTPYSRGPEEGTLLVGEGLRVPEVFHRLPQ
eukprot:6071994-Pyramimonas_sp.AAC.1